MFFGFFCFYFRETEDGEVVVNDKGQVEAIDGDHREEHKEAADDACNRSGQRGLLKPGIGWDWMGSDGTRSRVLAFGTFGSRVPGFDVIAITDLIYFSPLPMNDRGRMCIVVAGLIDLLQSIYQNFICCIVK